MAELKFEHLDRYAFCDPGGDHKSKSQAALKKVRARSAIVVIGVEPLFNRIFTLSAWADRCATDVMVAKMFETHKNFRVKRFGVEANAMQSLFAAMLIRESRFRGFRVPFEAIQQSTRVDKDFRIRTALQKLVSDGKLFIQRDQLELLNELRSFPTGQTKDLIDALASAVQMVPMRSTKAQLHEEEEQVLRYLRESGAPASVIEARFPRLTRERMVEQMRHDYRAGKV